MLCKSIFAEIICDIFSLCFKKLVEKKNISYDITLLELYKKTKKKIIKQSNRSGIHEMYEYPENQIVLWQWAEVVVVH